MRFPVAAGSWLLGAVSKWYAAYTKSDFGEFRALTAGFAAVLAAASAVLILVHGPVILQSISIRIVQLNEVRLDLRLF